jgi:hypothetical protein
VFSTWTPLAGTEWRDEGKREDFTRNATDLTLRPTLNMEEGVVGTGHAGPIKISRFQEMDEEDVWTERIRRREASAFIPFATRMWKYSLANGLFATDVKQLKRDYGKSFYYGQLAGLVSVLYWNSVAYSTNHS